MNERATFGHPALWQLQRLHFNAKWRGFARRVRTPRRITLTLLALLLGMVWLSQAALGLLFRPAANPDNLRVWIPISLLAYALWHVGKTVIRKPVEPFEWTPAECEWLQGAPLARNQLVTYRIDTIALAAAAKAVCFGLVMIPDLAIWPLGIVGMFLALMFLDLIRMVTEVTAWGLTPTRLRWARAAVISFAATIVASGLVTAMCHPLHAQPPHSPFSFLLNFLYAVIALHTTAPAEVAALPFDVFARVILAPSLGLPLLLYLVASLAMVGGAAAILFQSDAAVITKRQRRAAEAFRRLTTIQTGGPTRTRLPQLRFRRIPKFGGIATMAWRQLHGMKHYAGSIFVSMLLPSVLSLLAVFADCSRGSMVIQTVAALIFYSFLLMPAALRFDFRRDIDRMAILKSLPISPLRVTLGQLIVPIIACTAFQWIVMAIACAVRPFPATWFLAATLLFVPVNALIFSLENLIFLLYPYRPNQEGIGVFVRSILTFTGKGLLFGLALLVTYLWIGLSHLLAAQIPWWCGQTRFLFVFGSGLWLTTALTAAGFIWLIATIFARFDPSQDTPPP